jgi:hypothetical protein
MMQVFLVLVLTCYLFINRMMTYLCYCYSCKQLDILMTCTHKCSAHVNLPKIWDYPLSRFNFPYFVSVNTFRNPFFIFSFRQTASLLIRDYRCRQSYGFLLRLSLSCTPMWVWGYSRVWSPFSYLAWAWGVQLFSGRMKHCGSLAVFPRFKGRKNLSLCSSFFTIWWRLWRWL